MPTTGAARAKFYFQIVTTPTADTPGTTLVLHFDDKRYIFGHVSEGTQRALMQRAVGIKKVQDVFISGSNNWDTHGGLIGLILSIADTHSQVENVEKPRLRIHGGPLLTHTLASARRFVFRTGMPISVEEFDRSPDTPAESPSWSDNNIRVWALPVQSKNAQGSNSSSGSEAPLRDTAGRSPASSPGSPSRKRRLSDMLQSEDQPTSDNINSRDQAIRQGVISEMFDSDWSRDALEEKPWAEVTPPTAAFIRDPETKSLLLFDPQSGTPVEPDFKVLVRRPWPAALREGLPDRPQKFHSTVTSYIVKGYPQRGAFDPKKAIALGVPRGPSFSRLVEGNLLTLPNGTVVKPEMVLGPTRPGTGFAIIDLPDRSMVEGLLNRPEWKSNDIMVGVETICWILGQSVLEDARVQEFMNQLPDVQHLVSSIDVCPNYLALDSSAASAIRLNRISRKHFPVPVHDNKSLPQLQADATESSFSSDPAMRTYRAAQPGLKIQLQPKFEIQEEEVVPRLDTFKVVKDIPRAVHDLAMLVEEEPKTNGRKSSPTRYYEIALEPEIITLGTGSSAPSKYRNVSATLLRMPGYGNYLFDCGENTLGQLGRVFPPGQLQRVLADLKLIWVSHLHADHHLGTLGVIRAHEIARRRLSRQSDTAFLSIASEEGLMEFLNHNLDQDWHGRQLVCNPASGVRYNGKPFDVAQSDLHIKSLQTCYVQHCHGAQAVSVTFENGFKFSFSGDCRPSLKFARMGRGSDVLVHEATFDDELEGDAMAKKHTTTGEALAVAALMKAKNVVLTHFSQRYQKIPIMDNVKSPEQVKFEDAETSDDASAVAQPTPALGVSPDKSVHQMNICVAFDYMRASVSAIEDMHRLTPALNALFHAGTSNEAQSLPLTPEPALKPNLATTTQDSKAVHPTHTGARKRKEPQPAPFQHEETLEEAEPLRAAG